jgi:hypothetical protein
VAAGESRRAKDHGQLGPVDSVRSTSGGRGLLREPDRFHPIGDPRQLATRAAAVDQTVARRTLTLGT